MSMACHGQYVHANAASARWKGALVLLLPMLLLRVFLRARYCENKVLWSIVLNTCVLLPIRASPVFEDKTQWVTENAHIAMRLCDICIIVEVVTDEGKQQLCMLTHQEIQISFH